MGTDVHNDDINSLYMLDFRDYIDDGGGEDMTNRDEEQYVCMKLTVLADNNTYIDKYYLGEPALSFYIEDGEERILFDCGYSDVFLRNAERMNIDLSNVDTVVLSHGHDDHTGGLSHLKTVLSNARVIAHPETLWEKQYLDGRNAGSLLRAEDLPYKLSLSRKPQKVSEHLTFLGEIPQLNDFEIRSQFGVHDAGGRFEPDFVMEDSALVYDAGESISIITGCSHAGICNIVQYAVSLFEKPVAGIIGGFHLKEVNERVEKTIEYLAGLGLKELYPCHCTSFAVRSAIHQRIPVGEVGVGMKIEW